MEVVSGGGPVTLGACYADKLDLHSGGQCLRVLPHAVCTHIHTQCAAEWRGGGIPRCTGGALHIATLAASF